MNETFETLTKKVADLTRLFKLHKHIGSDQSQKLTIPTIYRGLINSTVANSTLPDGWSIVKTGTGDYTITHNLGNDNFVLVLTTYTYVASIAGKTSTTFEVLVVNLSGTATDENVDFILIPL